MDSSLRKVTLCYLIKDNQILLAMKKRNFGEGKWNGIGGKPNPQETIEQTLIRETEEEISVIPTDFEKVAIIDFYHSPDKAALGWNQQVHVYLIYHWQGKPQESDEMQPQWFDKDKIPFHQTWTDDPIWMPLVLEGKKVLAKFTFDRTGNIEKYELKEVKTLDRI